MEITDAITRLTSLSHEGRLRAFREIVKAGQIGISAGDLARRQKIPPNTLSAQLNILSSAGLVTSCRNGRSIIYKADLPALNELVLYLIEDCCEGRDEVCAPILDAIQSVRC
ncbi:MAG: helix-turn-helix domain-containing protein [Pseudomonadota bacterium]|nr:helix-turn-helix domain-containing protein [Pseudomonadota bacterium]